MTRNGIAYRRFIPTRVGNTGGVRTAFPNYAVHPHARGEHKKFEWCAAFGYGSSPRAWGTPITLQAVPQASRFIPTRVGNTWENKPVNNNTAVHPHARGEHESIVKFVLLVGGSSPRAWGTPLSKTSSMANVRFIPTRVGNTFYYGCADVLLAVHPHARGEHINILTTNTMINGSSPRAWGTRP